MRMVVQRRCALIESASVPRIRKSGPREVKLMAKFVAEGAHERAEGSDFLPHRRPHPHADQHGLRIVVAEKFTRPVFADSQRSGREHADTACWCSVELRGGCQKLCTAWPYFVPASIAVSIDFACASKSASCGRSSALIRSLSRNAARFALRGKASVSNASS